MSTRQGRDSASAPPLHVRTADGRRFQFTQAFHVGRGDDCEVQIDDAHISRKHVLVSFGDVDGCAEDRRLPLVLDQDRGEVDPADLTGLGHDAILERGRQRSPRALLSRLGVR